MKTAKAGTTVPVDFIALPRLNLLFVAARTQEEFAQAKGWIERLDRVSGGDEPHLHYYIVRNTSAATLASQALAAFGLSSGGPSSSSTQSSPSAPPDALGPMSQSFASPFGQSSSSAAAMAPTPPRSGSGYNPGPSGGQAEGLSIVPDEINNALIIRATDAQYREITDLLDKMDVPPRRRSSSRQQ